MGVCCRGGFSPEHSLLVAIRDFSRRLPSGRSPGQYYAGLAWFVDYFAYILPLLYMYILAPSCLWTFSSSMLTFILLRSSLSIEPGAQLLTSLFVDATLSLTG